MHIGGMLPSAGLNQSGGECAEKSRQGAGMGPVDAQGDLFDERHRIEALEEQIRSIVAEAERGPPRGVKEVGQRVIVPLLRALGWDVENAAEVAFGYETGEGSVHYALCPQPSLWTLAASAEVGLDAPALLILVVASSGSYGAGAVPGDGHVFAQVNLPAIQVIVSAAGAAWTFHHPAPGTPLENREFARVELGGDVGEAAKILDLYAGAAEVRLGRARQRAEREYAARRFPAEAWKAWRRTVEGDALRDVFQAALREAIGVPPDPDEVADFVSRRVGSIQWPAEAPAPVTHREVRPGDRVWVYDVHKHEIRHYDVVSSDADFERGEVSVESPIGAALMDARVGEERPYRLPGGREGTFRIVLFRPRGGV